MSESEELRRIVDYRNLPLKNEWPLLLCPPSSFSLRWIHAFKGTFELLEAAFLGKFSGYIHLLRNFNLLADDGIQIRDMIVHHLAILEPLFDKCFESFNGLTAPGML